MFFMFRCAVTSLKMVVFAPFRIPIERRLQTFAVSHFLFCFLAMALSCILLCAYIVLFTGYWWLLLPYAVFYFYDWDTPINGGKNRNNWCRNWKIWQHMSDYFPTRLHKTVDLDPSRNYIFGVHPHGVLCISAFTHFCSNGSGFDNLFPGFNSYLAMLPVWFRVPFYRDYIMSGGLVPSSKRGLQAVLERKGGGNICCIIPGGAPETLLARPGDVKIILKPRMGFLKLAITNGVPLVPVISYNDQNVWEQDEYVEGSFKHKMEQFFLKYATFCMPIFHARGMFQYNYGIFPYRKPLHTVVGKPISVEKNPNPNGDDLRKLQATYIEELQALFDEHKSKYADESCKLIIT